MNCFLTFTLIFISAAKIVFTLETPSRVSLSPAATPKMVEGIQGTWKLDPNTLEVNGRLVKDLKPLNQYDKMRDAVLTIKQTEGADKNKFVMGLRVINSIFLTVEQRGNTWKNSGRQSSTRTFVETSGRAKVLEDGLINLIQNPKQGLLNTKGQLVIVKGRTRAIFERFRTQTQSA